MPPISDDALQLLTAQHDQIDMLLGMVEALHDPDALAELSDTIASHPAETPQHQEIKRVLAQLIWRGVDDDDFVAELATLRALVDDHMTYEEDEVLTRYCALTLAS